MNRRVDIGLAAFAVAGLAGLGRAADVSIGLHPRSVFDLAWLVATVAIAALSCRVLLRLADQGNRLARGGGDRGSIAAGFALTFPIFLVLVSMVVQMSHIGTAALLADYAAFTAARSAVVSLSADPARSDNVRVAAAAVMTPVSPAGSGGGAAAQAMQRIQSTRSAPWQVDRAGDRFGFAYAAVNVSLNPGQVEDQPETVDVSLQYRLHLVCPPISMFIAPARTTVGGVQGRFLTIPASCELKSTGSRNGGWMAQGASLVLPSIR